ncbi:MAG: ATP/GTP-binding protein [Candidatus Thermoplasmatota archaeon]|nr:ATP/GTP-binding protein [Candidatus Thermoplasmatota archaeon]
MAVLLYLVGTAGSGKSYLTHTFTRWMELNKYYAVPVNLDPGAEALPYNPEIDIRDLLSLTQVMEEYSLGPNAAQIVCADLLVLKIEGLKEELEGYECDYFIIDTPGQIELFAFRESSKQIVEKLGGNPLIAYLFDPLLARTPAGFVSQVMLSATVQFRFAVPAVNLLSKCDLLKEEELDRMKKWVEEPYQLLEEAIAQEPSMQKQLSIELFKVFEGLSAYKTLTPISSVNFFGMEDLYSAIQQVFYGGEELEKR